MSVLSLLTQTCKVQSVTASRNEMGGEIKTFATRTHGTGFTLSALPCLIKAKRQDETTDFGRIGERSDFRLYLEYTSANNTVTAQDRIIVSSRTYEVRGTPYDPGGRNELLHIEVENIA